ncbi:MAG: methyltransferase domain-containing protein, partial [Planctomycetes bacterium]|nr:methyltransferase domain-containing protein [Planctomycetota bacterium]
MKPIQPPGGRSELANTGERYLPGITRSTTGLEHYHRYLMAAAACVGQRVLDIACGEGYGSFMVGQAAAHVVGADIDPEAVGHAGRKYESLGNLRFCCASCESLPFPDHSFDRVISFETIEHIRDQHCFLAEVRRVLVPGGMLIVSSPNKTAYNHRHDENEFHEKELEREEFRSLLLEHFAHVTLGQQQALFLSLLSSGAPTPTTFIERNDADGAFHFSDRLEQLTYSIAFAANVEIGDLPSSALLDTVCAGETHRFHEDSAVYEVRDPGLVMLLSEFYSKQQREAEAAAAAAAASAAAEGRDESAPAAVDVGEDRDAGDERPHEEVAAAPDSNDGSSAGVETAVDSGTAPPVAGNGVRDRLLERGKEAARGLGLKANPLAGAGGPANTMQPVPRRILDAAVRVAVRAALWVHRLRPSVARSIHATRGLFDANYYRRCYYDVSGYSDTLCAIHYAVHGWREGRRPGRLFDPDFYLREYPDVRAASISPLLHYVMHGADEWRAPHPDLQAHGHRFANDSWAGASAAAAGAGERSVNAGAVAAAADHWAQFEQFRDFIGRRRRDARRAWKLTPPELLGVDADDLDAAGRKIDGRLSLAANPQVSIVIP